MPCECIYPTPSGVATFADRLTLVVVGEKESAEADLSDPSAGFEERLM